MDKNEALKQYHEWQDKQKAYALALQTMGFDRLTIAPKDGVEYYAKQYAYLAGELFSIATDPKICELLTGLSRQDLAEADRRSVQLDLREFERWNRIPKQEFVDFTEAQNLSEAKWEEAKAKNDYAIFEPHLQRMIGYTKKFAHYRDPQKDAYDLLLGDYEEGMDQKQYDEFFRGIRENLLPLIHEVAAHQERVSDACLHGEWPVPQQELVMKHLQEYLGFDPAWGYMGVSVHPFTDGLSHGDVRVTTAYQTDHVESAVFSIIHEVGHAIFEHDINPQFHGTVLGNVTSGLHESQSRLFENYLGRSQAFWRCNYPFLQQTFPDNLKNVSSEEFVRAVNVSRPSLVRTEADELTYPIHILIRYEMEKEIFKGDADLSHLDVLWNQKMKEYLGVDVPDDAHGILQDTHWSDASFGYFPTYALGSAYAAQFYEAMKQELDVDALLAEGGFAQISAWLREHVHQDGALHTPKEVVQRATGKPFDPSIYIQYLSRKYRTLYQL